MIRYTFSKHIKFRQEKDCILICNCKLLHDFKVGLEFGNFIERINRGVILEEIRYEKERLLFKDFQTMKMLSELSIKQIKPDDFKQADIFMEKYLYLGSRPRTYQFLLKKLKENPSLFSGLYLDNEIIGVIQGFPRKDYILLSEIAIDEKFRNRGFGSMLLKEFEKKALEYNYLYIKTGAEDTAIIFYSANGYLPSLFIQVKEKDEKQTLKILEKEKCEIKEISHLNRITGIEIASQNCNLSKLKNLRKLLSPLSAQFLFTKQLKNLTRR
ncbi:MAG: GNAT family N-acetyltransferase [Nanoarchaeota archaeon]|nr:GNAT family N-acetyltransferase [Nanoarchaeota archaeon]